MKQREQISSMPGTSRARPGASSPGSNSTPAYAGSLVAQTKSRSAASITGDSSPRACVRGPEIVMYIAVSYMLMGASIYWAWYTCLPVALLALMPTREYASLALVLSFCARLAAPLDALVRPGLLTGRWSFVLTSAVGTTVPLLIVLWRVRRGKPFGPGMGEQPRIPESV